MAGDALSDLLRTVRLTGATFFDIEGHEPWAVCSPAPSSILPKILPGADHLISYHVVTAGSCFARIVGQEAIALQAGEVVVFTKSDPHIMSSNPALRADPPTADVLDIATAGQMPFYINCAGDGAMSARLVCGYLACDAQPFNPLLEALPPVIKAGDAKGDGGWLGQFIKLAVSEVAEKRAGSETVLTKLSELMFVDVLRRYVESLPPQHTGWLAGLRDPHLARALALIHDRPAHNWTVEALAKDCALSRTVLAERFTRLVGMPPMHYLAKWRMQIASELLSAGNSNMANIAAEIGYESEAAFSRAFKKMIGVPPSAWRLGIRTRSESDEVL
ncbi:AraC family transcriptional regulator [Mesorhizobium sp. WSM4303]|uniref:AraC family transcriptional regulator n=1 Tax=unclassified Mesorhizobium TaxID=325217 RepID=UPI00115CB639|nr:MULTISPECIES: AraC family transcriptional regulator [unclassified Mesorhizobium]TRC96744.1 AraC family transcriptional regulator [Mesorhizobium sp. WSM4306]TRD08419.1 AraC family transcriptional regulator [Mesorhizobium sp. WSM4303]